MSESATRQEDFPVETFVHLEGRLQQEVRKPLMKAAADNAAKRDPSADPYVVTQADVNKAVHDMFPTLFAEDGSLLISQ